MLNGADELPEGCTPIADVEFRSRYRLAGKVHSLRVQPWGGNPALACTLVDATAGITLVFLGRRNVPGIKPGVRLQAEGVVGEHGGRLAMLNPSYEILPDAHAPH